PEVESHLRARAPRQTFVPIAAGRGDRQRRRNLFDAIANARDSSAFLIDRQHGRREELTQLAGQLAQLLDRYDVAGKYDEAGERNVAQELLQFGRDGGPVKTGADDSGSKRSQIGHASKSPFLSNRRTCASGSAAATSCPTWGAQADRTRATRSPRSVVMCTNASAPVGSTDA